jgi:hypothetical protein
MSIGRQNGAANFSLPRRISARAGPEINRSPGRFNPDRQSDLLRRLAAWKPHRSCSLYGFATIELVVGLRLNDYPIFDGPKGPCISLTTGPALHRDWQRRIDANGKGIYLPRAEWRGRALADEFSQEVIAPVRQTLPEDLED